MDSNQRFLLKSFRKYYRANTPILPDRFTRREFGFMFFDKSFVQRHLGFANQDDLRRYMIGNVPAHSYYSTSYYRKPAAPTMDEKEWLGAELIFDLDADRTLGPEERRDFCRDNSVSTVREILSDCALLSKYPSPEALSVLASGMTARCTPRHGIVARSRDADVPLWFDVSNPGYADFLRGCGG